MIGSMRRFQWRRREIHEVSVQKKGGKVSPNNKEIVFKANILPDYLEKLS